MATLWFNFPQDKSPAQSSMSPKQPDVDFLVPMASREMAVFYGKEVFSMLKARDQELQDFVWEPLTSPGGEKDILEQNPNSGYFLLAQIRTDEFWLNICLCDQYFTPFQKLSDGKLIYSKIARIPQEDAKELFRSLTLNVSAFNALVHVGMGIGEAQREEPYCFLEPTLTVEEMDAELEAYMAQ